MNYSDDAVHWTGSVEGISSTTKISSTYKLETLNPNTNKYELLDTWPASTTKTFLIASGDYTTGKGIFRLSVTTTVAANGIPETASSSLTKTNASKKPLKVK